MGNDGGSIPTRRELVKSAARLPSVSELKATALEALTHAWQNDPVSSEPLDLENVVSDWRGRLYNYETVLQGLVPGAGDEEKQKEAGASPLSPDAAAHDLTFAETGIRSIRDVVRLHFTPYKSPSSSTPSSAPSSTSSPSARWQCPVTLKELGPGAKSVYLVPCGHVFSEAALITIVTDKLCPECSAGIETTNIIPILPVDKAEVAKLQKRIEALRADGLAHSLKKDKKEKKDKKDKKDKKEKSMGHGDDKTIKRKAVEGDNKDAADEPPKKKEKPSSTDSNGISSRINNTMTASLTARVLAEQEALQKRRKTVETRG